MYVPFFGLKHKPFSIAPDPHYLFMSERHREALAHLVYGVGGGGGFVLLTGEIGAGKTTVCRCFLEQVPKRCNVAYIFNPKLSALELMATVCHEFGIPLPEAGAAGGAPTLKDHVDALNAYLLRTHAVGQNNLLIIDEAQNLSPDVLEQLRLLTNLETSERKLLQIVLIGQPELRAMLARPELEQLAQRVIARYHLEALSERESQQYIAHRLSVAGLAGASPFDAAALRRIHQVSRGVPRRINLLCDRALLGAYASGRTRIDRAIVDHAAAEVFGPAGTPAAMRRGWPLVLGAGVLAGAAAVAVAAWQGRGKAPGAAAPVAQASASTSTSTSIGPAATGAARPPGAGPATLRSLEALQAALAAAPRDEGQALRQLAPAWQLRRGAGDPCTASKEVRCFASHGGLALLRLLARPAVLPLRDAHDHPAYALLTGLGPDAATLQLGAQTVQVPLAVLATAWRGDFTTFWRVPAGYTAPLTMGAHGPLVDAVGAQLAAQQGGPAPAPERPFDAVLRARVAAFQQTQGLPADGVAGATTLMQINRASGVSEPWLAGAVPAPQVAAASGAPQQR